jgi:hypothetical protein
VHRVIKAFETEGHSVKLLTKGDDNVVDDIGLYSPRQEYLERDDIVGKQIGMLRFVGMMVIILEDYSNLKYSIFAIISKRGCSLCLRVLVSFMYELKSNCFIESVVCLNLVLTCSCLSILISIFCHTHMLEGYHMLSQRDLSVNMSAARLWLLFIMVCMHAG